MSRRFINSAWHCISLVIMLLMNVMQRINIRYRKIKPEKIEITKFIRKEKQENVTKTKQIDSNRYCSTSCLCMLYPVGKCNPGNQDRVSPSAGRFFRHCKPDCLCRNPLYFSRDSGINFCINQGKESDAS